MLHVLSNWWRCFLNLLVCCLFEWIFLSCCAFALVGYWSLLLNFKDPILWTLWFYILRNNHQLLQARGAHNSWQHFCSASSRQSKGWTWKHIIVILPAYIYYITAQPVCITVYSFYHYCSLIYLSIIFHVLFYFILFYIYYIVFLHFNFSLCLCLRLCFFSFFILLVWFSSYILYWE